MHRQARFLEAFRQESGHILLVWSAGSRDRIHAHQRLCETDDLLERYGLGDLLGERLRILGVHGHLGLEKSSGNRLQLECY